MKFPIQVSSILSLDTDGFAVLNAANFKSRGFINENPLYIQTSKSKLDPKTEHLTEILDKFGAASSKAIHRFSFLYN